MPSDLLEHARRAKGFMPEDEGALLHRVALERLPHGPALEVDVLAPVSSSPPRSQETPQRRGTGQSNDSSSLQSSASMAMKQSPNLVIGAHGASANYSLPPGLH